MIRRLIEYIKTDGVVVAVIIAILAVLLSVTGCTKEVYVPVERAVAEVRVDTLRVAAVHKDSIYVRDSIFVDGATMVRERWRERYVHRTDTCYKVCTDTVVAYIERPVTVERSRSPIKRVIGAVIVALLCLVGFKIYKFIVSKN